MLGVIEKVSLMLSMCILIFGTVKAVVLNSGFCVSKSITKLESKVVYVRAIIKRWSYWPKGVTADLIDNRFQYK